MRYNSLLRRVNSSTMQVSLPDYSPFALNSHNTFRQCKKRAQGVLPRTHRLPQQKERDHPLRARSSLHPTKPRKDSQNTRPKVSPSTSAPRFLLNKILCFSYKLNDELNNQKLQILQKHLHAIDLNAQIQDKKIELQEQETLLSQRLDELKKV
jgi:hypothetical protein